MNQGKTISSSAIVSYCLSIIYVILIWISGGSNLINYSFIALHIFVIALLILVWFLIRFAIFIGFLSGKMSDEDKNKVKLTMQTLPHRMILGMLYWLLPIGLYAYYISHSKFFYVFGWLPLWYPIVYYLFEKYIKNKEKIIGSPIIDEENKLANSSSENSVSHGILTTIFLLIFLFGFLGVVMTFIFSIKYGDRIAAKFNPCENPDLTIETKIDCYANKSKHGVIAWQSKDISECDKISAPIHGNVYRIIQISEDRVVVNNESFDKEPFGDRVRAQCKAYVTDDISHCFNLMGYHWDNNEQEKGYRYNRAECILRITNGDLAYCGKLTSQQKLSSAVCLSAISKALNIHDKGLRNEQISDDEWKDILLAQ